MPGALPRVVQDRKIFVTTYRPEALEKGGAIATDPSAAGVSFKGTQEFAAGTTSDAGRSGMVFGVGWSAADFAAGSTPEPLAAGSALATFKGAVAVGIVPG
jgi:hypothetical protein